MRLVFSRCAHLGICVVTRSGRRLLLLYNWARLTADAGPSVARLAAFTASLPDQGRPRVRPGIGYGTSFASEHSRVRGCHASVTNSGHKLAELC